MRRAACFIRRLVCIPFGSIDGMIRLIYMYDARSEQFIQPDLGLVENII